VPLGTIDRTPPPFFRQGYSAFTKLIFFTALSVFTMVADTRMQVVAPVRAAIAAGLAPVQRALLVPVDLVLGGSDYLQGLRARWPTKTWRAASWWSRPSARRRPNAWRPRTRSCAGCSNSSRRWPCVRKRRR
jgi:hypothetical protein